MQRRWFLEGTAVAVVGLAGCTADLGESPAETPTQTTTTAETPTETPTTEPTEPPSCTGPINESDDSNRLVSAWSRNDFPPHEIDNPQGTEEIEDWNANYLGEHMSTVPSLEHTARSVSVDHVRQPAELTTGNSKYVVNLIRNEREREAILEEGGTDFSESILVLVGDCCGSSSVDHRWARVEETSAGIQLHGYLTEPRRRLANLAPRYSLLEVERPDDSISATCVNLTVSDSSRIRFHSADDIVTLVSAVIANDRSEELAVSLRVTTADNEKRVEESFSLDANKEWRGIGKIGESNETFTVELQVDELGIDVTEGYPADEGTLGIRIRRNGEAVIGRSNEI